jgi:hypothetical protein
MHPSEVKRELERLLAEAEAARGRLAALSEKVSGARLILESELAATVRSSLTGAQRTPGEDAAQESPPESGEVRAG